DEPMWNPAHDLAILEGARLRLVRVRDDVCRLARGLRRLDEAQLAAHREAGASSSAQGRARDLLDDGLTAHAPRLLESRVAADRLVLAELGQVALVRSGEDQLHRVSHSEAPRRSLARPRGGWARGSDGRARPRARSRSRRHTRSGAAGP